LQRYYAKKKTKQYNNGWDDENYDYKLAPNETLLDRYELKERIGKGSFGQVVRAYDNDIVIRGEAKEVAIKIIKSTKRFMDQAQTEMKLLKLLVDKDPGGYSQTSRMLDHFIYRGHQCIIFEMLYCNLYELLRNTNFKGVSLRLNRKFGRQILKTLAFLQGHQIIHGDLKPENLMLTHPTKSTVNVIDFGSACHITEKLYSYVQSRFYRAPEVILRLSYGTEIDMWSLGCVLFEMHTGVPLFPGKNSRDQMGKIIEVLGMLPSSMVTKAPSEQRQLYSEVISAATAKSQQGEKAPSK
jgi:serine/threonine protein kinase